MDRIPDRAIPALDASEPVSVDFGTVTGQQVELAVADSSTTACSDHGGFYVGLLTQPVEGHPSQYGLPSDQRLLMTVVDVGDRTVVMLTYGPGDADDFTASMGSSATSSPPSASTERRRAPS